LTNSDKLLIIQLSSKLIKYKYEIGLYDNNQIASALNSPVREIIQSLLNIAFKNANVNDKIDNNIKIILSDICDNDFENYFIGKIILASSLVPLYRLDPQWTQTKLIPLFNWKQNENVAYNMWMSFLSLPRYYPPVMQILLDNFLECSHFYEKLSPYETNYIELLLTIAIWPLPNLDNSQIKKAIDSLPISAIEKCAIVLDSFIKNSNSRCEFWNNKLNIFFKTKWPKLSKFNNNTIAESLARIVIHADDAFPDAFKTIKHFLVSVNNFDLLLIDICDSEICNKFPDLALDFISLLINQDLYTYEKLGYCLERITESNPSLKSDNRYINLLSRTI